MPAGRFRTYACWHGSTTDIDPESVTGSLIHVRLCLRHSGQVDHSTHVTLGGFLMGGLAGFGVGFLYAVARRGWRDLAGAKASAATAGRNAWRLTGEFVILGFFLAVFAALALGGLADR
jgi:hypothetical protein